MDMAASAVGVTAARTSAASAAAIAVFNIGSVLPFKAQDGKPSQLACASMARLDGA
jgi:hypothetical protein